MLGNLIITALFALLIGATPMLANLQTGAAPLRVDINSEGRADMHTIGWENWQPSGGEMSQRFGNVTVTLREGANSRPLRLSGNKAILIHGVTLGADGVVASGGAPAMLDVELEGLAPGPHTFVGYHHVIGGASGTYTIVAGDTKVERGEPSREARHNDEVGTSFIEFEAQARQPVVIRIVAGGGDRVTLSGFAGSVGGSVGSFHHNLLANNAGRNWSLAGALDQANVRAGRLDIRNVVVYNWVHRTTDGDGMPNKWESPKGLNPEDAADGGLDPDGDGYTNLEDYLNWLGSGNTLN